MASLLRRSALRSSLARRSLRESGVSSRIASPQRGEGGNSAQLCTSLQTESSLVVAISSRQRFGFKPFVALAACLWLPVACGGDSVDTADERNDDGSSSTGGHAAAAGGSAAGGSAAGGSATGGVGSAAGGSPSGGVGGSTASGGDGSGGVSDSIDVSCSRGSDCVLADKTCCGVCGAPTVDDKVAIASGEETAYQDEVCGADPPGCPLCPTQIEPNLYAICDGGECQARDLRLTEATTCTSDDDCRLRPTQCCECGAGTALHEMVAINISDTSYQEWLCEEMAACAGCLWNPPVDVEAKCLSGHCAVQSQ